LVKGRASSAIALSIKSVMQEKEKSRQVKRFKQVSESMKYESTFSSSSPSLKLVTERELRVGLWWIASAIPACVMKGHREISTSWRNSQLIHS
jgi:hypothetical protein